MPQQKTVNKSGNARSNKKSSRKKRVIRWVDPKTLISSPFQQKVFGDLPDEEYERFKEKIAKEGIQSPIEVAPDGITVIDGHQRLRAAIESGLKKVPIWVNEDLKPEEHLPRSIGENLCRRNLSKLDKARAFVALKRHYQKHPEVRPEDYREGDIRDHLARLFGASGNTLDRWARVSKAPSEIRRAFEKDLLTEQRVLKFMKWPEEEQNRFVEEIGQMDLLEDNAKEEVAAIYEEHSESARQAEEEEPEEEDAEEEESEEEEAEEAKPKPKRRKSKGTKTKRKSSKYRTGKEKGSRKKKSEAHVSDDSDQDEESQDEAEADEFLVPEFMGNMLSVLNAMADYPDKAKECFRSLAAEIDETLFHNLHILFSELEEEYENEWEHEAAEEEE